MKKLSVAFLIILAVLCFMGGTIAIIVPIVDYMNARANRKCMSQEPKVECIEGFLYTYRAFHTDGFAIMALAPLWNWDGQPKKCPMGPELPAAKK
jgi:hypothetical protein